MSNILIRNVNLNRDIDLAKKVIDCKLMSPFCTFGEYSMVYRTTNEDIGHPPYVEALTGRKDVFSITASGDQIINSVFYGGRNITGLDISKFTKYYAALKIAAVEALTKEEYIKYIVGDYNVDPLSLDLYSKLRVKLNPDAAVFWDSIFDYCGVERLNDSPFFGHFTVAPDRMIINNPFLHDNNFYETKEKLEEVDIKLYDGNALDINKMKLGSFDLILLSNILNYIDSFYCRRNEDRFTIYKRFLEHLPLKEDGIALTYNFIFDGYIKDIFTGRNYTIYNVKEKLTSISLQNEIMIYQKKKKRGTSSSKK